MKKTMKKIATMVAKIYMEILTIVLVYASTSFLVDIGYDMDWWGWGGCMDETFWVGLLAVIAYQVIRYQTRERVNTYLEKVNPKIQQIVTAANLIAKCDKDEAA